MPRSCLGGHKALLLDSSGQIEAPDPGEVDREGFEVCFSADPLPQGAMHPLAVEHVPIPSVDRGCEPLTSIGPRNLYAEGEVDSGVQVLGEVKLRELGDAHGVHSWFWGGCGIFSD